MSSDPWMVGVACVAIPDGVLPADTKINTKPKVRLCLSLGPQGERGPLEVDLRSWPEKIFERADKVRVFVGSVVKSSDKYEIKEKRSVVRRNADGSETPHHSIDLTDGDLKRFVGKADAVWKRIFLRDDRAQRSPDDASKYGDFDALRESFRPSSGGGKRDTNLLKAPSQVSTYLAPDIARVFEAMQASALATTILSRAAYLATILEGTAATAAAVPDPAFDAGRPGVPWWRNLYEGWLDLEPSKNQPAHREYASRNPESIKSFPERAQDIWQRVENDANATGAAYELSPFDVRAEVATQKYLHAFAARHEGLSDAGMFFDRQIGNLEFWRDGGRPGGRAEAAEFGAPFREEVAWFNKSWGLDRQHAERGEPEINRGWFAETHNASITEERQNNARRKLAAIADHPTLAKYVGLILDVEIDVDVMVSALSAIGTGKDGTFRAAIAASLVDLEPDSVELVWTTFELQLSQHGIFVPCTLTAAAPKQGEAKTERTAADAYDSGLLRLNADVPINPVSMSETVPTIKRFVLGTTDVANSVIRIKQRAAAINEREQKNLSESDQVTKIPGAIQRGIVLWDLGSYYEEEARTKRDVALNRLKPRILDVFDLAKGHRIDATLLPKRGATWKQPLQLRWRSLVARDVAYGSDDIDPAFLNTEAVRRVAYREDGYVRPMMREESGLKIPHIELFSWTGESLGVPSLADRIDKGEPDRIMLRDETCDLPIDVSYNLPRRVAGLDRRPPPLREGREYFFGARLCLLGGCGLRFEDAVERYVTDPAFILGQRPSDGTNGRSAPFLFMRRTEIEAPDILLLEGEPIFYERKPEDLKGESLDTMVVRSTVTYGSTPRKDRPALAYVSPLKGSDKARRGVVPPRITFDQSEQAGEFDNDGGQRPAGAFTTSTVNPVPLLLDPPTGDFPIARLGHAIVISEDGKKKKEKEDEPSRGPVLVYNTKAKPPNVSFYPDPMAVGFRAQFLPNAAEASRFEAATQNVVFFRGEQAPASQTQPAILELVADQLSRVPEMLGRFAAPGTIPVGDYGGGPAIALQRLSILLKPGEAVDIVVWSEPHRDFVMDHGVLRDALTRLRSALEAGRLPSVTELGGSPDAERRYRDLLELLLNEIVLSNKADRDGILETILRMGPLALLNTRRFLRLVHAVDRPLAAPRFAEIGAKPDIHAVVLAEREGRKWKEYVEQTRVSPDAWPSEPGGTTTFFVGSAIVDRASTGQLACDAEWQEFSESFIRKVSDPPEPGKLWAFRPERRIARLFSIDRIEQRDLARIPQVDFLHDDKGELQYASHAFPDGKARKLSLKLIATSRFTEYFTETKREANTNPNDENILPFQRSSSDWQDPKHRRAEIWVPCVFRPEPPEIDKVIPVFNWATDRDLLTREVRFKRSASLRIYLKRSWYSSGEGEMLGVVCWPPRLFDVRSTSLDYSLGDLEKSPVGEFQSFVTRWGADPIRISGQIDDLIHPDSLEGERVVRGDNGKARTFALTLGPGKDRPGSVAVAPTLDVAIVAYKPEFDEYYGQWYCDVAIDPGPAYFPFAQLGLVRYQPHAIPGYELSVPVNAWAQLMPRRDGRVTFPDATTAVLEFHGIGYLRSQSSKKREDDDLTNTPLLNVRLMRTTTRAANPKGWQPVLGRDRRPAQQLRVVPIRKGGELWWTIPIEVPSGGEHDRYGLLVEEVEYMEQDELVPGTSSEIHFTTKLAERGPMFGHLVEFTEPFMDLK